MNPLFNPLYEHEKTDQLRPPKLVALGQYIGGVTLVVDVHGGVLSHRATQNLSSMFLSDFPKNKPSMLVGTS